jgi:hypothetical protein
MHFFQNENKNMTFQNDLGQNRHQRYLKFWGNDYPYLSENRDSMQRWLPIPENSKAQRLIRNINGRLEEQRPN